jgi:hypothetical protein
VTPAPASEQNMTLSASELAGNPAADRALL